MKTFKEYVLEVKKNIREILPENTLKLLSGDLPPILIDVRNEKDYMAGHLPNALHIDRGVLELKIHGTVMEEDREIILYCGGGSRSALASESLQRMGFKNVYSMSGGFRAWKDKEFEISTS